MTIAMTDRYSCTRCGGEFTSPDERREHARQSHQESEIHLGAPIPAHAAR